MAAKGLAENQQGERLKGGLAVGMVFECSHFNNHATSLNPCCCWLCDS